MLYCVDTSSLVNAWSEYYTPAKFPSVWADLDQMISNEELIAPMEVKTEAQRRNPDLYHWLLARKSIFVELNEGEQIKLRAILSQFQTLVTANSVGDVDADPYVIALGTARSAVIITDEVKSGDLGLRNNPNAAKKIPDVCDALNPRTDHLNMRQFVNKRPGTL